MRKLILKILFRKELKQIYRVKNKVRKDNMEGNNTMYNIGLEVGINVFLEVFKL